LGEPVIRIVSPVLPRGAAVTPGNPIAMISTDRPSLTSPVVLFRTRNAAVPTGRPAGTMSVRRRRPVAASNVVTVAALAIADVPENAVKVTSLLDAVVLNPVPVMASDTLADAPIGVTADSVPA
jgi:hypothetical protein